MNSKNIGFVVGLIVAVLAGIWVVNGRVDVPSSADAPSRAIDTSKSDSDSDVVSDDEDERETESENDEAEDSLMEAVPASDSSKQNTSSIKTLTMGDVASHNSKTSCYSVISGKVYDLTSWISKHPGGAVAITQICGKDGTQAFSGQHGGQKQPESVLAGFFVANFK